MYHDKALTNSRYFTLPYLTLLSVINVVVFIRRNLFNWLISNH